MKKKLPWIILALATITIALIFFLITVSGMNNGPVQPLTLQDLDKLSKQIQIPPEATARPTSQTAATTNALPTNTSPNEPTTSTLSAHANATSGGLVDRQLPKRLERCVSTQEREECFKAKGFGQWLASHFIFVVSGGCYVLKKTSGEARDPSLPSLWDWSTAMHMLDLGEWDGARRNFQAILQAPTTPYLFRSACSNLAWFEDDPQIAIRLLELSCQDNDPYHLLYAGNLCRLTGSEALAEYYEARLRKVKPDWKDMQFPFDLMKQPGTITNQR